MEYLGCFQFWAIVRKAAMNILVLVFWSTYEIRIAGLESKHILNFNRGCKNYLKVIVSLYSQPQCMRIQLVHIIGIIIVSLWNFNHFRGCAVAHLDLIAFPSWPMMLQTLVFMDCNNSFSQRAGMNKIEVTDVSQ